jgi:hypothetical protein
MTIAKWQECRMELVYERKTAQEQLEKLYSRTREEVEEEEYLIEELRKIEIRRKEREKKQQVQPSVIAIVAFQILRQILAFRLFQKRS